MTDKDRSSICTVQQCAPVQTDFTWLLSPISEEQFVSQHWATKPLRIHRGIGSYYSQLLPELELEMVLFAASQTRGGVELLSEEDMGQACRSHGQALEGFRQGRSLRIDAIQRFSHSIMMLVRNLEEIIHCPINVNMYLTPGAGKKALKRHYDTHDVFVLQIHGDKVWRLYDPPFPSPLEFVPPQRHESMRQMKQSRLNHDLSARDSCILTDEFCLKAGDCLYLPRGFWHEAESKPGEVSCHLTVGIQPTTYLDVLSVALSQVALSDVRLREPLPFGFASESNAGQMVTARIAQVVADLPAKLDTEAALEKVAAHSLRAHKTGFHNNLLGGFESPDANSLDVESKVYMRDGMSCTVDEYTSPMRMRFGSQIFEITPAYEEACRFISNTRGFTVSELPGGLGLPEKFALVQQLISEGLLADSSSRPAIAEAVREPYSWLPIHLDLRTYRIQWLDFGTRPLEEPFFQQSVQRLRKANPNAKTRWTDFRSLDELSEQISPSGFIFHVSRCGSTLLSNGLRVIHGAIVISEAQPIGEAVLSLSGKDPGATGSDSLSSESPSSLLPGIIRAYGQQRTNDDKGLVIKFSSWNLLHIDAIRRFWPQVPCVVIVRDPVEVAVSCLEEPPGWMRWKNQPHIAQAMFGWDANTLASMSDVSFSARVIGEFLKSTSFAAREGCHVIDYKDLNSSAIVDVARLFGLEAQDEDFKNIEKSLVLYSKAPMGQRVFVRDRESKQAKATKELRKEIQLWAQPTYDNIIREGCRTGAV